MERKKYLILTDAVPGRKLSGKDILRISISKFVDVCPDIRVLVILPAAAVRDWMNYCSISNFNCPQMIVTAGFTPYHSLKKALDRVPEDAIVAIHDGSRPLVSRSLIADLFRRMEDGARALVPVVPASGSVMQPGPDGVIPFSVSGALLAQTPQMFLSGDIKAAYQQAYDTCFTDPASVAAGINIPLTPVEGERYNIRIVTPEDLSVAGALWQALIALKNS